MGQTTQDVDRLIPELAKNPVELAKIRETVRASSTNHQLRLGDARDLTALSDASVHLVVCSPPYWTLKEYNHVPGQLGDIDEYQSFLVDLTKVWAECERVLVPGGRLVVVVGDVCVSRREFGRHKAFPLHADIQVSCERLGLDNLTPIIWNKIANANFEAEGNSGGFLGKPFEPNAVIKNDVEFILMFRKPGGYRSPSPETRLLSVIGAEEQKKWFTQVWSDVRGASLRDHPAPYPLELAERLIRMFSFVGDTVLDPFNGTGTTMLAAMNWGRNSIGIEIDREYLQLARKRLDAERSSLLGERRLEVIAPQNHPETIARGKNGKRQPLKAAAN